MGKLQLKCAGPVVSSLPLYPPTKKPSRTGGILTLAVIVVASLCASIGFCFDIHWRYASGVSAFGAAPPVKFYANVTRPQGICLGVKGDASSYAGYIGIAGDTPDSPRRSFFWWLPASFAFYPFSFFMQVF
jgi:hypothetical protein